MKNFNAPASPSGEWHEPYFTPAPPRMLETPVTGSIEIFDRYPPRVRYAGTLWRYKVCGRPLLSPFTHKQPVTIIGRQGNCLLIEV